MSTIYYLQHKDILDFSTLHGFIYEREDLNYYFSDSFDPLFYIDLATRGFITVSHIQDNTQYLLPEIQKEYAVLHFENLHIPKKIKKLLKDDKSYSFTINKNFHQVLNSINTYHNDSWMKDKYYKLLCNLYDLKFENFQLISVELQCNDTNKITAGEIGYFIGNTYTSLSGFSSKEKRYSNYGKLQMILLSRHLENQNIHFWNLGHPYMQYKLDLGATIYPRKEFLDLWYKST